LTIKIDFEQAEVRRCSLLYMAGQDGSDYEYFYSSSGCRNGISREFIVRKPDNHCFFQLNTSVIDISCPCTASDYLCAKGFTEKDGECVSIECRETMAYTRKIGNQCQGGL